LDGPTCPQGYAGMGWLLPLVSSKEPEDLRVGRFCSPLVRQCCLRWRDTRKSTPASECRLALHFNHRFRATVEWEHIPPVSRSPGQRPLLPRVFGALGGRPLPTGCEEPECRAAAGAMPCSWWSQALGGLRGASQGCEVRADTCLESHGLRSWLSAGRTCWMRGECPAPGEPQQLGVSMGSGLKAPAPLQQP